VRARGQLQKLAQTAAKTKCCFGTVAVQFLRSSPQPLYFPAARASPQCASNSSNAAAIDECVSAAVVLLLRPTPCNWTHNPKFGQVFTLFFFHESCFFGQLCTVGVPEEGGIRVSMNAAPTARRPSPACDKSAPNCKVLSGSFLSLGSVRKDALPGAATLKPTSGSKSTICQFEAGGCYRGELEEPEGLVCGNSTHTSPNNGLYKGEWKCDEGWGLSCSCKTDN
jgi:hypothetical protein